MAPTATFVGLATLDIAHGTHRPPGPNDKITGDWQFVAAGGPATNAAVTFARLGGKAVLVAPFGSSPQGVVARTEVEQWNVTVIDLAGEGYTLPVASVVVLRGGDRSVVSIGCEGDLKPIDPGVIAQLDQTDVVLVDGHVMEASVELASEAKRRKVPVLFDGGSWKPGTDALLPWVTHAVASARFRPHSISSSSALGPGVLEILAAQVPHAAITRGGKPILWAVGDRRGEVHVERVAAVDTLGAGDIFHGALAYFMATDHRARWPEHLAHAAEVATTSCKTIGTRFTLKTNRPDSPDR